MTETTHTPETADTSKTREELEAEILALRAEQAAPAADEAAVELSTRDRSPIKPQDHKPKISQPATVTFLGETYTFDRREPTNPPTFFALNRGDMETVLTRLVGEDGLARAIKSTEDDDGFGNVEKLGDLVNAMFEEAGAKNS